ncbi:MAG: AEC family transporter [Acidimicrobiales bacterium]
MLAVVLACFAVGLVLQRVTPPTRRLVPWLDHAVISVTVPALIVAKLPDLAFGADLAVPVLVAWTTLTVAALIVYAASRRYDWSRETTGALLLVTPLGNTTFLGLAMVSSLLGSAALTRAVAYDQIGNGLGLSIYGSVIAAHWGSAEGGFRRVITRLLRFPPFIAVLVSFAVRIVELPVGLDEALGQVGRLVAPLAMLALGLRFRVVATAHARQAAIWCLSTKMVLLPLGVLAVALATGVRHDPAWRASVLESGMPPMVTAGVIAARAGLDEELATTVVGVGLILALVTIPLLALALG